MIEQDRIFYAPLGLETLRTPSRATTVRPVCVAPDPGSTTCATLHRQGHAGSSAGLESKKSGRWFTKSSKRPKLSGSRLAFQELQINTEHTVVL